jgi:hypothetical protein
MCVAYVQKRLGTRQNKKIWQISPLIQRYSKDVGRYEMKNQQDIAVL